MKLFIKILCLVALACLSYTSVSAGIVDIPGSSEIERVSINYTGGGEAVSAINNVGFSILTTIKLILMGILVIVIVYSGWLMMYSLGDNEEELSKWKRQIWYSVIGIIFVNIPGTLYEAFFIDGTESVGQNVSNSSFLSEGSSSNLFVDFFVFGNTLNDNIVGFLEIMIFILAVFMLTLAGINVLTSRGREEKLTEAKNKVLYTVLALIFVGIIEAWKRIAFGGSLDEGINLIENLSNLALFFAGPIALFFMTLAWYYYITSNGDEERVKKAKSIIVNTFIATVLILAAYTFLLDLATL